MINPPFPPDEIDRLRRLASFGGTAPAHDPALDALVARALILFPGADSAAITFVASDRVWVKACAGWQRPDAAREHAFCAHVILQHGVMVVEDALRDPRFRSLPAVTQPSGIRFYAGAPLADRVGVFCIIGMQPRLATLTEIEALTMLTHAAEQHLDHRQALGSLRHELVAG